MKKLLLTALAALGFASASHATLAQMYNYDIAATHASMMDASLFILVHRMAESQKSMTSAMAESKRGTRRR